MTHLHTIAKLSNEIPFVDTYFSISCMVCLFIYVRMIQVFLPYKYTIIN
jgi:hypothetical protein